MFRRICTIGALGAALLSSAALAQPYSDPVAPAGGLVVGQGLGVSGLAGGQVAYDQIGSDEFGDLRTYSIPIILPLEVTLGRLQMGAAFEYAVREYRVDGRRQTEQGPRFATVTGQFNALRNRRWQVSLYEGVNLAIGRRQGEIEGPETARLVNETYRLDTGAEIRYFFDRSDLRLGMGHSYRSARGDYDPGEAVFGSLSFGLGLGAYSPEAAAYPVTMLVGLGARYNYFDRSQGDRVVGTEYGAVFVAPGLEIASRSLNLQAMVEFPVQRLKPEEQSLEQEVRANFGMKYYLR